MMTRERHPSAVFGLCVASCGLVFWLVRSAEAGDHHHWLIPVLSAVWLVSVVSDVWLVRVGGRFTGFWQEASPAHLFQSPYKLIDSFPNIFSCSSSSFVVTLFLLSFFLSPYSLIVVIFLTSDEDILRFNRCYLC